MQLFRNAKKGKKYITVCLAVCTFIMLTAYRVPKRHALQEPAGIIFFTGTWKEAVAKAQQENKPIFMDIYATWCGPCRQLKKKTFPNKEVADFYNTHFINISLDGEKGEGVQLAAALHISAYPTLFYFDKNGKPVTYSLGFQQPRELIETGKAALEKMN